MMTTVCMAMVAALVLSGDICDEDVNECERGSAPCLKRGVCHNFVGSFRCDCLPGWDGTHCQHSDGSGLSTCLTGYTGANCTDDFDECTQWIENPCEHGSTCTNTPGNFSCSCATGWEGRICNQDINECNLTAGLCHNGGNCTNIPGSYKCVCPYPYAGMACDDVSSTTVSTTTSTRPSISSLTTSTTSVVSPRGKSGNSSGPGNEGVPTVWIITGSCIGLVVVVVVGVGAVLLIYKRYHRRGRQVDTGDEGVVEGTQN